RPVADRSTTKRSTLPAENPSRPHAGRGKIVVMEKEDITADVAARLVALQFPQWADLPVVPVALDGWDNTTFRLGDELLVRLPSGDAYVAQVDKEHRWLPI